MSKLYLVVGPIQYKIIPLRYNAVKVMVFISAS